MARGTGGDERLRRSVVPRHGNKTAGGDVEDIHLQNLVPQAELQPHVREFRASLARIPNCRIELKGTEQAAHKIEIEYRR
jgi:hypothetical protein